MKGSKTLAIASLIATIGAGTMGASTVFAAQHGTGFQNGMMSGLVNALAEKFHLAPSEVQSVIDQQRQLAADQMKKTFEDRSAATLARAVKDGKLTQAQADLITAKRIEIKTFMDSLKGKSGTDRQTAMKTETDTLNAWATTNNIPLQYVLPFGGRMMNRGGGMGHGMMGRR